MHIHNTDKKHRQVCKQTYTDVYREIKQMHSQAKVLVYACNSDSLRHLF